MRVLFFLFEICAAHESLHGPNRRLPQRSDSVAIGAIADAAAARSRLRDQGKQDEAHCSLRSTAGSPKALTRSI